MLNGKTIEHKNFSNIINNIKLLHNLNIHLIIIYNTHPQINTNLTTHHHKPLYHKNIHITNTKTLKLIKQTTKTLQLNITTHLSINLNNTPLQNTHINIINNNFIITQPLNINNNINYYHNKHIQQINKNTIHHQLNNNTIILIKPITISITNKNFNLTSKKITTQLTIKLKTKKIINFYSSQNITNNNNNIISKLFPNKTQTQIKTQKKKNNYNSNTIHFLHNTIKTYHNNIHHYHLINYQKNNTLLQKLFSHNNINTQIIIKNTKQIHHTTINNINNILKLIHPLKQQNILIHHSHKQLKIKINKFTIIQHNNTTITYTTLYPFPKKKIKKITYITIHPNYHNSSQNKILLKHITTQTKQNNLNKLFILTTHNIH